MLTCLKSTYGFSKIMCRCVLNLGFGIYFKTPDTFINAVSVLKMLVIFTWCFDFNAMRFTGTCFIMYFLMLYFNSVGLWRGCGIGWGWGWGLESSGIGVGGGDWGDGVGWWGLCCKNYYSHSLGHWATAAEPVIWGTGFEFDLSNINRIQL